MRNLSSGMSLIHPVVQYCSVLRNRMIKLNIRVLLPFLQPLYVGWILFTVSNVSEMRVARNDFVKGKYDAFDIVPVLSISNAAYLATVVEIEQHKAVGLGVNEKIPRADILMSDATLEIQVINNRCQLPEPFELKHTRLILAQRAARDVKACKADDVTA